VLCSTTHIPDGRPQNKGEVLFVVSRAFLFAGRNQIHHRCGGDMTGDIPFFDARAARHTTTHRLSLSGEYISAAENESAFCGSF